MLQDLSVENVSPSSNIVKESDDMNDCQIAAVDSQPSDRRTPYKVAIAR